MLIKPLSSILIKPAGPDCNLNCDYCFYLDKAELFEGDSFRMNDDILEELIKQGMEQSGNEIVFLWQGGEPTLMGLDFFKMVVELQQKYGKGKIVGNGLQTNGTLINSEWVSFLKEYNFLVGLSIDGPEFVHDYHRRNKNNKGSWKKVLESYLNLSSNGVAVNILATVSKHSAQFTTETYNFFKKLNASFIQYIPILETNKTGIKDLSITSEQYGSFLVDIWNLWVSDFQKGIAPNIRTFEAIFGNYTRMGASECTFSKECGSYIVVEHNGDVFPCDYFVKEELKLGNIKQDQLKLLLNSKAQHQFGKTKENLNSKCISCDYNNYCFGGCLKNRILTKDNESLNYFCDAYKRFFELAHPVLADLAKQWEQQEAPKGPKTFDASGYF